MRGERSVRARPGTRAPCFVGNVGKEGLIDNDDGAQVAAAPAADDAAPASPVAQGKHTAAGDAEGAQAQYAKAVEGRRGKGRKALPAYSVLGAMHLAAREWSHAQKVFEQALKADPADSKVRHDEFCNIQMGNIFYYNLHTHESDQAKYNKHLEYAKQFYMRTLKRSPGNFFAAKKHPKWRVLNLGLSFGRFRRKPFTAMEFHYDIRPESMERPRIEVGNLVDF